MATADKLTLSQRMEQARERTVEARKARGAGVSGLSAAASIPTPAAAVGVRKPALPQASPPPCEKAAPPAPHTTPASLSGAWTRPAAGTAVLARPALPHSAGSGQAGGRAGAPASHHPGSGWQVRGAPGEQLMLLPGQMHFGGHVASMRTLLGSCVAVTIWHPVRKLGGMCHFLLPSRTRKPGDEPDGRYGDEALETMVSLLRAAGTSPSEYHAHLCGGADTMPEGTSLSFNVGERNIEQGFSLVDRYGFEIQGVDVGEDVPRTVTLQLATGKVDMRRGQGKAPALDMVGAARTKPRG